MTENRTSQAVASIVEWFEIGYGQGLLVDPVGVNGLKGVKAVAKRFKVMEETLRNLRMLCPTNCGCIRCHDTDQALAFDPLK